MELVLASPEMLAKMVIEDIYTITDVLNNNDIEQAYLLKSNILTKYEGYEDEGYDIPVFFDETYINVFDSLKWLKNKLSFSLIKISITFDITNNSYNSNTGGDGGDGGDDFKEKVNKTKKNINSIEDESKRDEALEQVSELEDIHYSGEDSECKYSRFKKVMNWLIDHKRMIFFFLELVIYIIKDFIRF